MIKPLVSIIIPCYNQGKYLSEAINSIIHQSHQHLECIIVNDGSTDMTHEIALGWVACESRIKYYYQNSNGVSSGRNLGLKNAQGNFIQFLDADDILEPHKLATAVRKFDELPEIDLAVSGAMYFDHPDSNKLRHNIIYTQRINNYICIIIYPYRNTNRQIL
jgi:glycosyltransferase involved in cell wall biosynthesis